LALCAAVITLMILLRAKHLLPVYARRRKNSLAPKLDKLKHLAYTLHVEPKK
jgi:hypothetical protein